MKKSHLVLILILIGLIGGFLWLLKGADPKKLQRQEVTIKIEDNFEK